MAGRRKKRDDDRDPRVQRVAKLLIGKHGPGALTLATDRAYDRLGIGDYGAAVLWTRVAQAIHFLLPDAKPKHAHGRIGASLDEVMNDPVMTAVVGDHKNHRRRAVHKVMTRAKRKLGRRRRRN